MKLNLLFTLLFITVYQGLNSQGFIDVTSAQGINMINNGNSILGVGLSFYDFDKDGWDDLTYSSSNDSLVLYRNLQGQGFQRIEMAPFIFTTDAKQPTWVDYDNDGDADLMWSKRSNGTRLYRNDGNMVFTDVTASLNMPTGGPRHVYGFSWADYDKDGWLDVYMCLYNNEAFIRNYLLRNNGNGTFTNVASSAGVDLGAFNSFQSVWLDINKDSWPDLYVINDLSQDSHLFINNGNGTFQNIAVSAGVTANIQAMSNSWSDYDQDGDWDLYITEALMGNILYRNNGDNTFTNVAADAGVLVNSYCWGAQWIDYDHNTLEDLHVTSATNILNQDFFYINNGDGTFTNPLWPVFSEDYNFTFASAKGDFNHDGYWDLSVTRTGTTSYQLLQGVAGDNNWVKLSLEGTHSNRDAIGTQIDYYLANKHLMKYTKCGENFLSQNSQYEILSMGDAEFIDSLVITWPRGLVERFYNVPAGEWLSLIEGENTQLNLSFIGPEIICPDQFATIDAGPGVSYMWSNGQTSRTIEVTAPGNYSVSVTDANGYVFTANIDVTASAEWDVEENVTPVSCDYLQDGVIEVISSNDVTIQWQDNTTEFIRTNLGEGVYQYTLTSEAGCAFSSSVELTAPEAPSISSMSVDPLCYGASDGNITVQTDAEFATILWSDNNESFERESLGSGVYSYTVTVGTCTYSDEIELSDPEQLTFDISISNVTCNGANDGSVVLVPAGGTGSYDIQLSSGSNIQLSPGTYSFGISDQNDCSVSGVFEITEPEILTAAVEVENANDGNNGSAEVIVTGGVEPYEFLWNNEMETAVISGIGQGTYVCTVTDANNCTISAEGYILDINVSELIVSEWLLYPNPASDFIVVQSPDNTSVKSILISDVKGRIIEMIPVFSLKRILVDLKKLSAGNYILRADCDNGTSKSFEVIIRE